MKPLTDLKAILHSKRANIYYLEHCRVMQKNGRVVYLTETKKDYHYWNIPIANTTVIMLGVGTSITQAAVRMLAGAGVLIGFCGGGATPLLAGVEIEWLSPQSEYRPTQYLQGWLCFWFDEKKRLAVAKKLQLARLTYLNQVWRKDRELKNYGFYLDDADIAQAIQSFESKIPQASSVMRLLQQEAEFAKKLYKIAAQRSEYGSFRRDATDSDMANSFLNHGNYLAYGLAACTLWVLGIPHGFAVMHGKTRRGALVFDIADLIKDSLILPKAFISAKEKLTEQQFRKECLQLFSQHKALDFMFNQVKTLATTNWDANKPS